MKYCCCSISSSAIISCCIPVKSKIQKYTKDYILLTSFFQEKDVHAFPRMLKIDLLLDHSPIPDGDLLTTATFSSRPCAKVLKLYFVLFFLLRAHKCELNCCSLIILFMSQVSRICGQFMCFCVYFSMVQYRLTFYTHVSALLSIIHNIRHDLNVMALSISFNP